MGVPTSEVGYTSAMPRREDHEVHKRTYGGIRGEYIIFLFAKNAMTGVCMNDVVFL